MTIVLVAVCSAWADAIVGYGTACAMHLAAEADAQSDALRHCGEVAQTIEAANAVKKRIT